LNKPPGKIDGKPGFSVAFMEAAPETEVLEQF
jgi:hypothetical protein